ncbi:MAG TPA: hypothetical protein VKB73_16915 [Gaiellaceae bacterium]|nr:hypothetical protein [Gaiellaceae bacterium]
MGKALIAVVLLPAATSAGAAAPPTFMCADVGSKRVPATILGTHGNDTITGTSKRDVIAGRAGDDVVDGRGGSDHAFGGPGRDTCRAEVRSGC